MPVDGERRAIADQKLHRAADFSASEPHATLTRDQQCLLDVVMSDRSHMLQVHSIQADCDRLCE